MGGAVSSVCVTLFGPSPLTKAEREALMEREGEHSDLDSRGDVTSSDEEEDLDEDDDDDDEAFSCDEEEEEEDVEEEEELKLPPVNDYEREERMNTKISEITDVLGKNEKTSGFAQQLREEQIKVVDAQARIQGILHNPNFQELAKEHAKKDWDEYHWLTQYNEY